MITFKDLEHLKTAARRQGSLPLISGGLYQVWLKAAPLRGPGTLTISLGGQSAALPPGQAQGGWFRVGPAVWRLNAGEPRLFIDGTSERWNISQIYIAGTDFPKPEAIASPTPAPAAPAPAAPAPAVAAPDPGPITGGAVDLVAAGSDPMPVLTAPDREQAIPSPWPGVSAAFLVSRLHPKERKHTIAVVAPAVTGGVILDLARINPARTQLRVVVEVDGRVVRQADVPVADGWTAVPVDLTALPAGTAGIRVADLDRRADPRGFVLAVRAQTVAGRAPTAADRVRERVLLLPDVQVPNAARNALPLAKLLRSVCAVRRTPAAAFDPTAVRILAGGLDPLWMAAMRRRLPEVTGSEPVLRQVAELGVAPDWWKTMQTDAAAPVIDTATTSVVVLAPSGAELSLGGPDAIAAWARAVCGLAARGGDQRTGGLLPVVVIGNLTSGAPERAAIDTAWAAALPLLANDGIPVIDVRLPAPHLAEAHREATAHRLSIGLRNLAHQIRILRDGIR
jgi:hypothetical protein